MANGTTALSVTDARDKVERLERAREREKAQAEERTERLETAIFFGGTRLVSRVVATWIPSLGPLMPAAEGLGAFYGIFKSMDPSTADPGRYLGAGLALAIGPIDKIGDFLLTAVGKFTNK